MSQNEHTSLGDSFDPLIPTMQRAMSVTQHAVSPPILPLTGISSDTSHQDSSSEQSDHSLLDHFLTWAEYISIRSRVVVLIATGVIIGSIVPKNQSLHSARVQYLSSIIGYMYTLCWSISFYPQMLLNYKRKSVAGLSADFSTLNIVGYTSYTIYLSSFFFSTRIRLEYEERFNETNSVQSNDVAFAVHALLLSCLWLRQIFLYDKSFGWGQLMLWTRCCIIGISLLCTGYGFLVLKGYWGLQMIDYLYMLSSIKLAITIIKHIPQVFLNYQRQSTVGWDIVQILLDFSGGILSFAQIVIDAVDMSDISAITGNWAKFGLSIISILFDIVFIVQHYILYPNPSGTFHHHSHVGTETLA